MVDEHAGVWVDPTAALLPLGEYAWRWWETRFDLAPRTREIYELSLRCHVLPLIDKSVPALGAVPLSALTPNLVGQWYRALHEHRKPSVAPKSYTLLHQILRQAVDDDLLLKNPCRIPRGGSEHSQEQRYATLSELHRLADAVPERFRALVLTAGYAGLRFGELAALRCWDLDLEIAVLVVRRKRIRLANGDVMEGPPKSHAGLRSVALPRVLTEELRQHLAVFGNPEPRDYVFTSEEGEPIDRSNFGNRVWRPATRAAGVAGLRFHDLRHTAGTLAAQTGASTTELMARLGHSSPRAALIYQHASTDRDRRIAALIDEMARQAGVSLSR
jgi:integrase